MEKESSNSRTFDSKDWAILVIALLLLAIAAYRYWPWPSTTLEEQARVALAGHLKDPFTAQFRNLREQPGGYCGEVNAKNGFGAYAGFTHFYVMGDLVIIDRDDDIIKSAESLCE